MKRRAPEGWVDLTWPDQRSRKRLGGSLTVLLNPRNGDVILERPGGFQVRLTVLELQTSHARCHNELERRYVQRQHGGE